jgi:hypothetical protein
MSIPKKKIKLRNDAVDKAPIKTFNHSITIVKVITTKNVTTKSEYEILKQLTPQVPVVDFSITLNILPDKK